MIVSTILLIFHDELDERQRGVKKASYGDVIEMKSLHRLMKS